MLNGLLNVRCTQINIKQNSKHVVDLFYPGLDMVRTGTSKCGVAREIMAIGFELGSHYQMMDSNPAQNFGVVRQNSVHLKEEALPEKKKKEKKERRRTCENF